MMKDVAKAQWVKAPMAAATEVQRHQAMVDPDMALQHQHTEPLSHMVERDIEVHHLHTQDLEVTVLHHTHVQQDTEQHPVDMGLHTHDQCLQHPQDMDLPQADMVAATGDQWVVWE
jgi:hypothetical protein